MKNIPIILFLMLIANFAIGQHTVKGKVTFDNGRPLPGATVQEKDANNGTITDKNGSFTLTVSSKNDTLVFSFTGFKMVIMPLKGQTKVTLEMVENIEDLDEVVVVGYGTVRKSDLTGAVSSIKVEDNVSRQSVTVDQLLQGRAAGVQVTQNGGSPGSGISVRIRGTNSLRGNNEPLYVIDGVIVSSAGEDVEPAGGIGNSGQEVQNGLNGINPRDIASIEVLKDASATAIYGSRGANGVVLITTKKGTDGTPKINAFVTRGTRNITKKYGVLDAPTYARYRNESALINGADIPFSIDGNTVYPYLSENNQRTLSTTPAEYYNWQDEIYQTGTSYNFGGSVSGGTRNGNYYISAGYNDQNGIVSNSRFQSGDVRFNLNQQLTDRLKIESRMSAFFSATDFMEGGDLIGANQSFVRSALSFNPLVTTEIDDFTEDLQNSNPFAWVNDFADESKENRYIGSLSLTYDLPIKGLKYQIKAGGNVRTKDRRRFFGVTTFQGANANGALQMSTLNLKSYQINNILRYFKVIKKVHRISAFVGTTYDVRNLENSIYAVEDFVTTELTTQQPFLGQVITTPFALIRADQELFSILGRVNYTLKDKYVLTASVRRDGVSKFSEENRYGIFPSFAAAWRLGEEKFVKDLNLFDNLKLRAGWGQIGNHGIGPYGTLSNYGSNTSALYGTPTNGTSVPIVLNNIANPDLTWETTEQLNFGVDFGFLDNRISGTVDWYDKTSKDLLQNIPIPTSSGFQTLLINRGSINNSGVELGMEFIPIAKSDLEVRLNGNIAFNTTRIEALGIPLDTIHVNGQYEARSFYFGRDVSRGNIFKSPANIFIEGEESALFYGFQTDGIYQTGDDFIGGAQAGDIKIVDQNGDGVIDEKDRTVIGNPNPDFVYGFGLTINWKRFRLSALFNGVHGNDVANGNLLQMANAEGLILNIIPAAYHEAWRPNAPSSTYPRIGYTTNGAIAVTDRIIEDGSFLRLNNLTIGYDVPTNNTVSNLNVYVSGQNLFTWTNYRGYNPEVTSFLWTGLIQGVDWNGAPNASNILVGLNITF